MKKLLAIVLAALMMFTVMAPASAEAETDVNTAISVDLSNLANKVTGIEAFFAQIKDFVHKFVGTITQFFGSECPFCDGEHIVGAPSASVKVIEEAQTVTVGSEDYVLDVAYNFEPATEAEYVEEDFATWHADFVVTTNKDVKNILLAGQYDAYSENYVGMFIPELKAGEEVRLLATYGKDFTTDGKEVYVNCEELYTKVKSFNCGLYNGDSSNVGAQITVELRLYETEAPTEENWNSTNFETGRVITVATIPCTIVAA